MKTSLITPPITDKVAKIDNTFIVNAQYKMTAKEQKVLYYLISHLDPKNEQDFNIINVPIRQLEENLKEASKKWGSLYEEVDRICASMIAKNIAFPSNIMVEGKPLKGRINFFSSIRPVIDEQGQTAIRFAFSPDMKPFLLQLHHYVNIGVLEVVPMTNAHAIRMFSIFKSEKNRLRHFDKSFQISYSLEELKGILGITEKYQSDNFKDFRIYVLDKIRDEINDHCPSMLVEYDYIKTFRKITGIIFKIHERKIEATPTLIAPTPPPPKDKKPVKNTQPTEQELATLTRAKLHAYMILVNYGVYAGIVFKQIIPKIKGSEFEGFEDFFIEKSIQHFEKNAYLQTTQELKASTFVTWWTKNKVFESGEVWADILEKLVKHKKDMQKKNPEAFDNRVIAKTMTNTEFENYYNSRVVN